MTFTFFQTRLATYTLSHVFVNKVLLKPGHTHAASIIYGCSCATLVERSYGLTSLKYYYLILFRKSLLMPGLEGWILLRVAFQRLSDSFSVFFCMVTFLSPKEYVVLIIRKIIRILWGKNEGSCLWGLARFVLELPTGPLPPPHCHPSSAGEDEAVGEASPPVFCIFVLEGSRLMRTVI